MTEAAENTEPVNNATETGAQKTEQQTEANQLWSWIRFGMMAFFLMVFYIYNQHHANSALRKKDKLIKELKELHSEKISIESEITNASKQSELAKKLEPTGLKELKEPPIKLERHVEKKH
jgi:hypothetical protein